jgi:hypothetical protein
MYQPFPFQGSPKFTQIGIFGLKIDTFGNPEVDIGTCFKNRDGATKHGLLMTFKNTFFVHRNSAKVLGMHLDKSGRQNLRLPRQRQRGQHQG